VVYQDLPEGEFKAALLDAGLPDFLATMLAESDVGASNGGLFEDGRQLSALIGRPTTPLAELVKQALG
jgi:NAD(P)H dehydrogenase (quinone)